MRQLEGIAVVRLVAVLAGLLLCCCSCMIRVDGEGIYVGVGWQPLGEWVRERVGSENGCEVTEE